MKRLLVLLVIVCCLWPLPVIAADEKGTAPGYIDVFIKDISSKLHQPLDGEDKISTITGIIPVCDDQSCEQDLWDAYINDYPKLRFLDRRNIKAVVEEHKLNLSGLTEIEQSIKAGKFINASHLLLHKKEQLGGASYVLTSYPTKLLNISTLEIEFTYTPRKAIFFDGTNIRSMLLSMASVWGDSFYPLLNALNRHALNTDGKAICVVYDDVKVFKFELKDGLLMQKRGVAPSFRK